MEEKFYYFIFNNRVLRIWKATGDRNMMLRNANGPRETNNTVFRTINGFAYHRFMVCCGIKKQYSTAVTEVDWYITEYERS